jgi:hypothetical protein
MNLDCTADIFAVGIANGQEDPAIPPRGFCMIGDESDGGARISFGLSEGQTTEVGFIKVFWSTEKLELDNLEQRLPALQSGMPIEPSRKVFLDKVGDVKDWGTVVVTVVQRAEHL